MKLTKREIDALTCPPGRRDRLVFDDELRGFGLRITSDGSKVFLFQYRAGGQVRRLPLGLYGELTPAEARQRAEVARGQVRDGGDPVAERAQQRAAVAEADRARRRRAEADALTLGKLIELWALRQLVHRSERYRTEACRALRVGLAALLDRPAHQLDSATVRRALDAIPRPVRGSGSAGKRSGRKSRGKGSAPVPAMRGEAQARRVRAYGRAMYGWAVKRGLVPTNPFAAVFLETRDVPRDRVLTDAELGEVWRATGAMGWPWGSYLRMLLLTLQRRAEVAGMEWGELAPDFATWELPAHRTKNRKPHIVHLAEAAGALLREAPRLAGSPLVFTTTGTTAVSGFEKAKARLVELIEQERAKLAAEAGREPEPVVPWRLHDFRRTGVTALARLGVRIEVADRLLNHIQGAISGVAAVYQRHDFLAEREAALNLWAAHVLAVAAGTTAAANVVELRPTGASPAT